MEIQEQKNTRKRGVILTNIGLRKLQKAIISWEKENNNGERIALDRLAQQINVSTRTLSRLWSLNTGVDRRTLSLCFTAFNLKLTSQDYTTEWEESAQKAVNMLLPSNIDARLDRGWLYPDRPLPLDSPFYIDRPPIESLVYREIVQPGAVIRIRSPRQMGKTSLVTRLLAFATAQGYRTVNLNCLQIDNLDLADLPRLLRSFCWQIATQLGLDPQIKDLWDEEIGAKLNCSFYLRNYLLKQSKVPIVLVLSEVDRFFEYPHIARDFFALLRSLCDEARQDLDWQKLRLVVVYSAEQYISLDINHSPFNIGLPIRLDEFTQLQVEDLADRYGLDWTTGVESMQLISLVGGHPALIQIAMFYLCTGSMSLEDLIQSAIENGGVYRHFLWRQWLKLQANPHLVEIYTRLVRKQDVTIKPIDAYKLESLGLIRCADDGIIPSCKLYQIYFAKQSEDWGE